MQDFPEARKLVSRYRPSWSLWRKLWLKPSKVDSDCDKKSSNDEMSILTFPRFHSDSAEMHDAVQVMLDDGLVIVDPSAVPFHLPNWYQPQTYL